ncbi:hypothetical protein Sme01_57760 [Sphaerisporangium melleum]|uniref:DUF2516 domain-containing protein n=1 Tax=Sphaerisporangium melleum TaxID=321316 RepID=A0A917R919_9ACTN|nr:DUF2516 family protein [Sphaerisporangium melleum]GGK94973.1 hypothetical protein GCM10007964_41640 [Sphaerisporangium melleum]GII73300.1 hypothetical protein Sme01_57760 [Sphaerisporangium melleum]
MLQIHGVLDLIFWVLAIAAFCMCAWALFHAIRTPARAFAIAGKLSKPAWLAILGLAALFSFAAAVGYLGTLSIFTIASVIASGVYLADVKPAVGEIGRGGSSGSSGPYGPW